MLYCPIGAERKNSIAEFLESIEKSDLGEASDEKDEGKSETSDKVKENINTKNYYHKEGEEKKRRGKKHL